MAKNTLLRKSYICTADYDLCHLNAEKHLTFHCHNITCCYFYLQFMKGVLMERITIFVIPAPVAK